MRNSLRWSAALIERERALILLSCLSVIVFAFLAFEISSYKFIPEDIIILRAIHSYSTPVFDTIAVLLTKGGGGQLLVIFDLVVLGYLVESTTLW